MVKFYILKCIQTGTRRKRIIIQGTTREEDPSLNQKGNVPLQEQAPVLPAGQHLQLRKEAIQTLLQIKEPIHLAGQLPLLLKEAIQTPLRLKEPIHPAGQLPLLLTGLFPNLYQLKGEKPSEHPDSQLRMSTHQNKGAAGKVKMELLLKETIRPK
jgi:hypothetical protein